MIFNDVQVHAAYAPWHPTSPTQCGHLSPEKALPGEQKCLLCPAIVALPFQSQSDHLMAPANWGPDVGCIHIGIFLHTNSDTLRLSSEFSSIRPLNSLLHGCKTPCLWPLQEYCTHQQWNWRLPAISFRHPTQVAPDRHWTYRRFNWEARVQDALQRHSVALQKCFQGRFGKIFRIFGKRALVGQLVSLGNPFWGDQTGLSFHLLYVSLGSLPQISIFPFNLFAVCT